jgi:hypothetical protein
VQLGFLLGQENRNQEGVGVKRLGLSPCPPTVPSSDVSPNGQALAVPILAHAASDTLDMLLLFLGKYPGT